MKNQLLQLKSAFTFVILLYLLSGKLSAQSEIIGYSYIGALNGHPYYLSNCWSSWDEANDVATQMGGYLATITTEEEDGFLRDFIPYGIDIEPGEYVEYGYGGAWVGLIATNSNGSCDFWQWDNGESFSYQNWTFGAQFSNGCGTAVVIGTCPSNNARCPENIQSYGWWTTYSNNNMARYIVEFESNPYCNTSAKSYVCHNGNTICINTSALQSHLNHGDLEGPCGPCNTSGFQSQPKDESSLESNINQTAHALQSGSGEELVRTQFSPSNPFEIFPNPVLSEINVVIPEPIHNGTLRIHSLTGQEMLLLPLLNHRSITIDLSTFTSGIYLVEIRSSIGHYQKKIVKL